MTATTETEIRRHPDGSIDTNYYIAIGRKERANAANEATRRVRHWADTERLVAKILPANPVRFATAGRH